MTQWKMWNGKGKYLGGGVLSGAGIKSVFIKRVQLGNITSDEAERQGIKILRGKKLHNVEVTNQGDVVATFEDGTTAKGNVLVGCDGVHSRTRHLIDPVFPGATYSGLINSGGFTSGVRAPSTPETINFIFCKRAFFGYHVSSTGYIYWFVNWPEATQPARDAFEGITSELRKQQLLELFRDDQPFISEIIQVSETTFPYFPSFTLPKQPTSWYKGPIVLVGDAAHAISPSSGQGASMALEDAAILAKCLRDIPDLEQAFATYEHLRRGRTTKMYEVGEKGDSGKHAIRPIQQCIRDMMTPVFLKLFANPKASDWMYSYRTEWDTKVSPHLAGSRNGR